MRRVGQARQGPMLLKLYGPKPGPARRTQARGPARPDVLRPEARPGPRGLRARAGLATSNTQHMPVSDMYLKKKSVRKHASHRVSVAIYLRDMDLSQEINMQGNFEKVLGTKIHCQYYHLGSLLDLELRHLSHLLCTLDPAPCEYQKQSLKVSPSPKGRKKFCD